MSAPGLKVAASTSAPLVASLAPSTCAIRGITRALAVIVQADGADAMMQRAVNSLGLLPAIRWVELDSPWTSDSNLLTVQVTDAHSLTVALAEPENDALTAEVGELLGIIATMIGRERTVEIMTAQARTDALTGLWNRRAFAELMDQALSRAARTDENVALLVCDIDDFKGLNDALGHAAGDRALVAVADSIRAVTRPSDVAARIGGDEIAILLASCDAEGAIAAAERLATLLRAANPCGSRALTLSVGIADVAMLQTPGPNATSRTLLLRLADEALYIAKRSGRNVAVPHPGADALRAA